MTLEENIKGIIEEKLSDGSIEKIMSEKFEKGINEAMAEIFRSYGIVGKAIREKVESVMAPAIEKTDFSEYIVKLDTVLTEIVNSTSLVENKKILENFKELMIEDGRKVIKTSELFEQWCNYVAANVETNGLEVNTDDEPTYESVECTMEVEYEAGCSWSDFEKANIVFECEHDEDMNFSIPITRWQKYDGEKWDIDYRCNPDISSLRYMNSFEVFLCSLKRSFCKLQIDDNSAEEGITPEAEPEANYS